MAYQRWWKTIRDQQGNAVNGASVAVYNGGTGTLALVYDPNSDDASPSNLSNPFVTTANGVFGFMAADGEYDVQISGGNGATQQYRVRLSSAKTSDLVGVPAGGASGQVLAKASATDYDDEWIDPPVSLPAGGTTGQALTKASNADLDVAWTDVAAGGGGVSVNGLLQSTLVKATEGTTTSTVTNLELTITQGRSIGSVTITPTVIGSKIRVKAHLRGANSATYSAAHVAIFKDGASANVAEAWTEMVTATWHTVSDAIYEMTTTSLAAITFEARAGSVTAGTFTVRGDSFIEVQEIGTSVTDGTAFSYYDPDKPPTTPSTLDDEFNGTSLDAKWTTVNWGSATVADVNTTSPGKLHIAKTGIANYTLISAMQAIPSGDFTIYTKIASSALGGSTNDSMTSLILADGITAGAGNQRLWGSVLFNSATPYIQYNQWTGYNTYSATGIQPFYPDTCYYLRIRRSGTTYYFAKSVDGKTWGEVVIAIGITPTHFGIGTYVNQATRVDSSFDFFRYFPSATAALGGNRTVGSVTPSYQLALSSTFPDLTGWTVGSGSWAAASNEVTQSTASAGEYMLRWAAGGVYRDDGLVIEADVKLPAAPANDTRVGFAISNSTSSTTGGLSMCLRYTTATRIGVARMDQAWLLDSAYTFALNTFIKLRVVLRKNVGTIYLDGVVAGTFDYSSISTSLNYVNLYAYNGTVVIKNLKVWNIPDIPLP